MKWSNYILILLSLLFTLSVDQTQGQLWKMRRFEAVAAFGPTFFFGDVGGFSKTENILGIRDIALRQTRFDLNVNVKYRITSYLNARLSLAYGLLHAIDTRGSNDTRGFEATISILEPALIGEYYFIKNRSERSYLFSKGREGGGSRFLGSLDFYFFTGIGGLSYSIRPNDLLAQKMASNGAKAGGFTAVIPVGLGTTMAYSPDINFGVELSRRICFSDNLDGYTSQYSSSNDVYYFFNFTITYKMKIGPNGLPSFR